MTPTAERSTSVEVQRVQRPTTDFPVVHLESVIPSPSSWSLIVEGLAQTQASWSLDEIRAMRAEERVWDLHCVWGWTREKLRWEGIPVAWLLDAARPLVSATHVMARQIEGPYASCLTMAEARASLLAWRVDSSDLTPEHGGPLRLVTPPGKWAYKNVKWAGRLTLLSEFTAGFWEEMVGNSHGDMPPEMQEVRFE